MLRLRCRGWEGACGTQLYRGRSPPSRVWSLPVRLHWFCCEGRIGPSPPCLPSILAHVDASALRGCSELVTAHQVSAETPEQVLGIPIDTVYDLCAGCATLGGGDGL